MVTEQAVREALVKVHDPELKKNIVDLNMVKDIRIAAGEIGLTLALTTLHCPRKEKFVEEIQQVLGEIPGVTSVQVKVEAMTKEELDRLFPRHPLVGISKVKYFIAVASGKGGVGKTTVAINLALALSQEGFQVGLLDADVYGPSIPVMMDLSQKPEIENGMLVPLEKFGLKVLSFGFLVDESRPFIWRGPMVAKAIRQFLDEVLWGELDFLVVDLPPGTGDPSITIAQCLPKVLMVIVTTPQKVALADVKRAINMFGKMDIKILGLVENMSFFKCSHSDEKITIFGEAGGERLSKEMNLPLLGAIPLDMEIRQGGDQGIPLMIAAPASEAGLVFKEIARQAKASITMV